MYPTPKSYEFDYENYADFLLLDPAERRWLVENDIAPWHWYDPTDHLDDLGDGY